jgi:RNA polymerase sigma factor (sigma-70 family)
VQAEVSRGRDDSIERFDDVLARARAGEPAAWRSLYERLAPAVAGYLRLRGARDVDDLTSEVFLAVFRNIATFRGNEDGFRSWVFVITHRRLQDERRHRGRHGDADPLDGAVHPAAPGSVHDEAMRRLATERVRAACAGLAPDQGDVVLLRIVADLAVEQVARVLGKSPGAVKQLQRRAFETLRRTLDPEGVTL